MRLLLLLASARVAASAALSPPRPNILLLLPDQWRHDWTPATPSLPLRMPVLDSLAASGTTFRQAYVPSPLCAPSRAALASGREYDFCGVPDNFSNDYPLNQTTFYSLLQGAGYWVMSAGKDDLTKATGPGLNGSFHARELGFNDSARNMGKEDCVASAQPRDPYGAYAAARSVDVGGKNESLWAVLKGDVAHCCAAAAAAAALPGGGPAPGGYVCPTGSYMPQNSYCDDYVTANALALLARKPAAVPWFLQINFSGPHPPFVVTPAMFNSTHDRTWPSPVDNALLSAPSAHKMRADYASELENLDGLFGAVLAALDASGEAAQTIVIVASDHGEMLGDHDDYGKELPWQGSASVPLLVSAPWAKQANQPNNHQPANTANWRVAVQPTTPTNQPTGPTTQTTNSSWTHTTEPQSTTGFGCNPINNHPIKQPDQTNQSTTCAVDVTPTHTINQPTTDRPRDQPANQPQPTNSQPFFSPLPLPSWPQRASFGYTCS